MPVYSGTGPHSLFVNIQRGETKVEYEGFTTLANVVWVALYGWWMAGLFFILSGLMALTVVGIPYANLSFILAKYLLWPFGKYVIEKVPCTVTLRN